MENETTHDDRRAHVRKPCAFDVVWTPEGASELRGHGFEVSTAGLVFAVPAKTAPATMTVTALVRGKSAELEVEVLRKDAIQIQDAYWTKLACRITAADTTLWDAMIESVPVRAIPQPIPPAVQAVLDKQRAGRTATAAVNPAAAKPGAVPAAQPIPLELAQRIAKLMVTRERMDPWKQGELPAIAFSHVAEAKDPLGRPAQHYKIETKRQRQGKVELLSTIIAIVEGGEIMIVSE